MEAQYSEVEINRFVELLLNYVVSFSITCLSVHTQKRPYG